MEASALGHSCDGNTLELETGTEWNGNKSDFGLRTLDLFFEQLDFAASANQVT